TVTRSVYLVVLSKADPSPLAPESDDEKVADEKKKDEPKKDEPASKKVKVRIDFDNIGQRILAMPLPPRRYISLRSGAASILLATESAPPAPGPPNLTVPRFDLNKRKSDVVVGGVRAFRVSFDGGKILYQQGDKWVLTALKPIPDSPGAPPPAPS